LALDRLEEIRVKIESLKNKRRAAVDSLSSSWKRFASPAEAFEQLAKRFRLNAPAPNA